MSFVDGVAERLLFAERTFDLVTCQAAILGGADDVWSAWSRSQAHRWFVAGGHIHYMICGRRPE